MRRPGSRRPCRWGRDDAATVSAMTVFEVIMVAVLLLAAQSFVVSFMLTTDDTASEYQNYETVAEDALRPWTLVPDPTEKFGPKLVDRYVADSLLGDTATMENDVNYVIPRDQGYEWNLWVRRAQGTDDAGELSLRKAYDYDGQRTGYAHPWVPEWRYTQLLTQMESVEGVLPITTHALPIEKGWNTRMPGWPLEITVETVTQPVDSEEPPIHKQHRAYATTTHATDPYANITPVLFGSTETLRAPIPRSGDSFTVRLPAEQVQNLKPGATLEIAIPRGWTDVYVSSISNSRWNVNDVVEQTDWGTRILATLKHDPFPNRDLEFEFRASPPSTPDAPYHVFRIELGNTVYNEAGDLVSGGSLSRSYVAMPLTASTTPDMPSQVYPSVPYPLPVTNDESDPVYATFGTVFAYGGNQTEITRVTFRAIDNAPALFDADALGGGTITAADGDAHQQPLGNRAGTWRIVDERTLEWTGSIQVNASHRVQDFLVRVPTLPPPDCNGLAGSPGCPHGPVQKRLPKNPIEVPVTFDNGATYPLTVEWLAPGVYSGVIPPATGPNAADGYPAFLDGNTKTQAGFTAAAVHPITGVIMNGSGAINVTAFDQNGNGQTLRAAAASGRITPASYTVGPGDKVIVTANWSNIMTELEEITGISNVSHSLDVYVPPLWGKQPYTTIDTPGLNAASWEVTRIEYANMTRDGVADLITANRAGFLTVRDAENIYGDPVWQRRLSQYGIEDFLAVDLDGDNGQGDAPDIVAATPRTIFALHPNSETRWIHDTDWVVHSIAWAPDSRRILVVSENADNTLTRIEALNVNGGVTWTHTMDGTMKWRQIATGNLENGREGVAVGMNRDPHTKSSHVLLIDVKNGKVQDRISWRGGATHALYLDEGVLYTLHEGGFDRWVKGTRDRVFETDHLNSEAVAGDIRYLPALDTILAAGVTENMRVWYSNADGSDQWNETFTGSDPRSYIKQGRVDGPKDPSRCTDALIDSPNDPPVERCMQGKRSPVQNEDSPVPDSVTAFRLLDQPYDPEKPYILFGLYNELTGEVKLRGYDLLGNLRVTESAWDTALGTWDPVKAFGGPPNPYEEFAVGFTWGGVSGRNTTDTNDQCGSINGKEVCSNPPGGAGFEEWYLGVEAPPGVYEYILSFPDSAFHGAHVLVSTLSWDLEEPSTGIVYEQSARMITQVTVKPDDVRVGQQVRYLVGLEVWKEG